MEYSISIFFLLVIGVIIYLFALLRENKYGKFDIKASTLDYDALINHAAQLAANQELAADKGNMNYLLNRLNDNYKYILNIYLKLMSVVSEKRRISGADEWILDNFYIIEERIKMLRQSIKRRHFKNLPIIKDGQYTGYPRIFAIALEFVNHTDSTLTKEHLVDFIKEYQRNASLSDAELWALPSMVEIALVENIKYICTKIEKTQQSYRESYDTLDELFLKNKKIAEVLGKKTKAIKEDSAFIENMVMLLKKNGKKGGSALHYIDRKLSKMNKTSEEIIETEHKKQISRQVSAGNAIMSLKFILSLNYTEIFESLSEVEKILKNDPSGVYPKMDKKTKAYYRKRVEKISREFDMGETETAKTALELAEQNNCHVGKYLIETRLGKKNRVNIWGGVYFLSIFLITLLGEYIAYISGGVLGACLFFILSLGIAVNVVNYTASRFGRSKPVLKMDFSSGVLEQYRTLVVISSLVTSEKQAEELAKKIEVYHIANKDDNIYFGILGDFKDNVKQHDKNDRKILLKLESEIEKLNEKYGNKFFLFFRKRTLKKEDKIYMGYERKRGALTELSKLLRGEKDNTFLSVRGELDKCFKYIITLDSDTKLPKDSAYKLIGAMAHPLNAPVVKGGRVVSGYGIMQPSINVDVEDAHTSFFTSVFAGQGGIDSYSGTAFDIYQDLFGEGIFAGKGIFDIDVFCEVLADKIPDNKVLSHDLLEGCYLRCASVNDIFFTDGFPKTFFGYIKRMHRWIRGDWQLLPWLVNIVKNPLSLLSKWKIFDNLRRSLMTFSASLVILTSFNLLNGNAFLWVLGAVFSLCLPFVMSGINTLFRSGKYHLKCHSTVFFGIRAVLYEFALTVCLIPYYSYISVDAFSRALYRTFISKKKTLEWVTAAETNVKEEQEVSLYYKKMLISVVFGAAVLVFSYNFSEVALILGLVFCLAPLAVCLADKPYKRDSYKISEDDRTLLLEEAKKVWSYFESFTKKEYNYLTPDNFQEEPPNGAAERTSPTNIGLQFAAAVSAYDLKLIKKEKMLDFIENTLSTVERMEKWNGHLYNWYNIKTLEVLRPRYISSVDSGNLCGYLMTTAKAIEDMGDKGKDLSVRLFKLADEMNFKVLYDDSRDLFSIGYNAEEEHITRSYYDLLASEARQLSFIAIAKGDAPKEHWFTLNRTLVMRGGYRGLLSWTGTMFEYLMPLLIMKCIPNTLLYESYHFVVRSQMKYGRQRKVPWGTSESGFNSFDSALNYQYKAFGVPDLGLKRGLANDVVVAPYASVMALMVNPKYAMENLRLFKEKNISGKYGFYEAIDYTPERVTKGETFGIVKSYMVHHLGMSILSINNVLNENILQKRFHSNLTIMAVEELLTEKVPTNVIVSKETVERIEPLNYIDEDAEPCYRDIEKIDKLRPNVHLLSNGRYTEVVNDSGCGYCKDGNILTNRFRSELEKIPYGNFMYVKRMSDGEWWSTSYAPCYKDASKYRTVFVPHKAEFYRKDDTIDTLTEVIVSAEENAEIRKVTFINHGESDEELSVCNYKEIALSSMAADTAHPAFSNLFIKTRYDENTDTLIAERRPRGTDDSVMYAMQTVCVGSEKIGKIKFETDRAKFIGRGNTPENPDALKDGYEFKNTSGAVLDPVMSQQILFKVPKGKTVTLSFISAVCKSYDEAVEISSKYKTYSNIERAFELSYTRSKVERKYLSLLDGAEKLSYDILANILYIMPYRRSLSEYISKNTLSVQDLWALGISGDNPIVVLRMKNNDSTEVLKKVLKAHEFLRIKGVISDLVVISEEEASYTRPLLNSIKETLFISHARDMVNISGGVYLLDEKTLSGETKNLLFASARAVIDSDAELTKQLESEQVEYNVPVLNSNVKEFPKKETEAGELKFFNGIGGFTESEYVIKTNINSQCPLPWSNVVANERYGFLVTENGGGYMWSTNSRENKISPWLNDPVSDLPTEMIYLKDESYGNIWKASSGNCVVRNGAGYSVFEKTECNIKSKLTMFVPVETETKINMLELENEDGETRNINLTYYLDVLCGVSESVSKPFIVTKKTEYGMSAHNTYNKEFEKNTVYVNLSESISSYTGDRNEFFVNGTAFGVPEGLKNKRFLNTSGAGYNPCIAVSCEVKLAPGEKRIIVISSGTENFICDFKRASELLGKVKQYWDGILNGCVVKTPDESFDLLVNRRLLYQTVACRIFARTSLYQCGGAYGFRDQLQDVMAILQNADDIAYRHILRSSKHQFVEGDVQHWWHPSDDENKADKGIRTKFSDDFLWLPYVAYEYVRVTGNREIFDMITPYISEEPLGENEDERYGVPLVSEKINTIYGHCQDAIEHALKFGEHGLPLMGSGDWNDGMNKIGNKGKGESVWLGFFLYDILKKYGYDKQAEILKEDLNKNAWDGNWYRRAYTDEGLPVGSSQNTECKIDAIAQSWSVISGAGKPEYIEKAMKSVFDYLVNKEDGLIKLLTPPFENGEIDAGYIKSYVPGIRENGGQYTHAAVWVIMAFALLGDGNTASELFSLINPINHTRTAIETAKYKAEPYAVAADVYSTGQNTGRAGWTWYTGAAGWMYRTATEYILGIKKQGEKLIIDPCIPTYWEGFTVKYRYKTSVYNISVKNPNKVSKRDTAHIEELKDDGMVHNVSIEL